MQARTECLKIETSARFLKSPLNRPLKAGPHYNGARLCLPECGLSSCLSRLFFSGLSPGRSGIPAVINVDVAHPGAAISPQCSAFSSRTSTSAADGGLYPELVKNRSFEFNEPLMGWHEIMVMNAAGWPGLRANWMSVLRIR